jgi:hypothetical protein
MKYSINNVLIKYEPLMYYSNIVISVYARKRCSPDIKK